MLVADVLYEWNATHAVARSLPTEVLVACFAHLRASDLVRVTHVSRQWRSIALVASRLWAESSFFVRWPQQPERIQVDRLTIFLERGKPHPVDIDLSSFVVCGRLLQHLVHEHMSRMRSFRSVASSTSYTQIDLRQPAPVLLSISCIAVQLSDDFLAGKIGRLERLQCRYVSGLSNSCLALSTLCSFKGTVEDLGVITTLLLLCPGLEEMVVSLQSCPTRVLALAIPPSLARLSMYSRHSTDWTDLVARLDTKKLRSIALGQVGDPEACLASLRTSMGDPVHLDCSTKTDGGPAVLVMLRDMCGVERGVHVLEGVLAIPRNISCLTSLTLGISALYDMLFSQYGALYDFPILTSLRIEANIVPELHRHLDFRAPRLERLTWQLLAISPPNQSEADLKHLPSLVRALLEPSDICLAYFELVWPVLPLHHQLLPPAQDILTLARAVTVEMTWVDGYSERHRYYSNTEPDEGVACDPAADA